MTDLASSSTLRFTGPETSAPAPDTTIPTREVPPRVPGLGAATRRLSWRAPALFFALGAALALTARPAPAQTQIDPLAAVRESLPAEPDAARRALQEILWKTVAEVGATETMLAVSLDRADSLDVATQDRLVDETITARQLLTALLDTIVYETEWGGDELQRLRRRYPASVVFLRYEAELAGRQGDDEAALAIYDRILGMRATDAASQSARAATLERLGRTEQAIAAYSRALELAPANDTTFRALVRLHRQNETLPVLLEQVRRLRTLYPDTPGLSERETEILHRLGRVTGGAADAANARQPLEVAP